MNAVSTIVQNTGMQSNQVELIKQLICPDCSDEELIQFCLVAKACNLNPLKKQIYNIPRWDRNKGKMVYTPQASIEGLRTIAERTGKYAPGRPTEFEMNGKIPSSATAYVKKMTTDGTWHEVGHTVYWEEYVSTNKEGKPVALWSSKPRVMLGKCAEAAALRRCFPDEMAGIYCPEEMSQVNELRADQYLELRAALDGCSSQTAQEIEGKIKKRYDINELKRLPAVHFERVLDGVRQFQEVETYAVG